MSTLVKNEGNGTKKAETFVRPRVDVYENDAELLLVADVPGVAKDAVQIQFEDNHLEIEAKREPRNKGTALAQELVAASYRCGFTVPEGIDAEKIEAKLDAGVLTVHLPKAAAKRARRIEVRAG